MKSFLVFSSILILIAPLAHAQSVSEEIVVTASALPETIETTPASATVITREQIEQREARDVADVLREVPGVVVSRTGSAGKVASAFIRGGSTKQALVLWNGIELNNAYFSAYNFGQLATAGVERVEVVRGPFSALYGADAVSGVINVLTVPDRSGFAVDVEGGEHGLRNGALAGGSRAATGQRTAAPRHVATTVSRRMITSRRTLSQLAPSSAPPASRPASWRVAALTSSASRGT